MQRDRSGRVSPAARLIALAALAVLLPAGVLLILQYRSLADLETKTKAAVQANLRQTLEAIAARVEGDIRAISMDALGPLDASYLLPGKLEEAGKKFATIRRRHPEIDRVLIVSFCPLCGEPFAVVPAGEGAQRVRCDRSMSHINAAWAVARGIPWAAPRDFSSFQPLSNTGDETVLYLFRVFSAREDSFAVATLNPARLARRLLPEAAAILGRNHPGALLLSIFDESKRTVLSTGKETGRYETRVPFGPILPRWELAAAYEGTTIEALARAQFHRNLLLTGLVLCGLVLGLELTLRAAAREARLAQLKSAFVSNISHEMKTPLALIRLFAETLEMGRVKSAEKLQEYYRVIHNESRRLTQLIDNVLDFSKMEAGRKEYQFAPGDVGDVVEEVIRSYEYQIRQAGFELTVEIERPLPPAMIDANAISQAVLNLLNNAVKYSPEEKQIGVRVSRRPGEIAIDVADRGIGIPKSEHERIFEKFYRVSTGLVHNTKGSGLGLALARHMVEAHGGRILVDSAPGAGSRFTILLPAPAAEAAQLAAWSMGDQPIAEGTHRRG